MFVFLLQVRHPEVEKTLLAVVQDTKNTKQTVENKEYCR